IYTYHTNRTPYLSTYTVDNQELTRRTEVKDLGITFESNLKFPTHIKQIRNKALQMLGFIQRHSKEFSSVTTLKVLYFAYVRSVLEYASVVWSPNYNFQIKLLESVQHRFLKFLAFKTHYVIPNHDYKEIENLHQIANLEYRRQINNMMFFQKLITNRINGPDLIQDIQIKIPLRKTRNHTTFKLKKHRSDLEKYATLERCSELWNLAGDKGVDVFCDGIAKVLKLLESGCLPFKV
ncbi:hypothetical protein WDU94_005586, partial [Cyamophila willieti]